MIENDYNSYNAYNIPPQKFQSLFQFENNYIVNESQDLNNITNIPSQSTLLNVPKNNLFNQKQNEVEEKIPYISPADPQDINNINTNTNIPEVEKTQLITNIPEVEQTQVITNIPEVDQAQPNTNIINQSNVENIENKPQINQSQKNVTENNNNIQQSVKEPVPIPEEKSIQQSQLKSTIKKFIINPDSTLMGKEIHKAMPVYNLISQGRGITRVEEQGIVFCAMTIFQEEMKPLSNNTASYIQTKLGGDWLVIIYPQGKPIDYNLTFITGDDFMVFTIDTTVYQVCRLR